MIISEERFAAGYVDASGTTVAFDDLDEFLRAMANRPELIPISFVHDVESGGWMKAGRAFFATIAGFPTPMGSGIGAFATPEGAAAFARRLGAASSILRIGEALPVPAEAAAPLRTAAR